MSSMQSEAGKEQPVRQSAAGHGQGTQPVVIEILRRKNNREAPYRERFLYTPREDTETVASALTHLNEETDLRNAEGERTSAIRWEHSCLQKKCGACAMVINGRPSLACDAFLTALSKPIYLEPLRKFPVVADLLVDRSVMFDNLKAVSAWLDREAELSEKKNRTAHEASLCIQCGCCLEVCPNFMTEGTFFGMSAMVPLARILSGLSGAEKKAKAGAYQKHIYNGCGKSLACQNICPAGIDIQDLMVRSNAAAVWRNYLWKRKKADGSD